MARVCDEFGCTPSQAVVEIEDTPYPLLWDVMEARAYARVKRQIDDPKAKQDDLPTGPMADLVWKIKSDRFARARGLGKYRPAKPPAS